MWLRQEHLERSALGQEFSWVKARICTRSGKRWALWLTWWSRLHCLLRTPQQVGGTQQLWDGGPGKGNT